MLHLEFQEKWIGLALNKQTILSSTVLLILSVIIPLSCKTKSKECLQEAKTQLKSSIEQFHFDQKHKITELKLRLKTQEIHQTEGSDFIKFHYVYSIKYNENTSQKILAFPQKKAWISIEKESCYLGSLSF